MKYLLTAIFFLMAVGANAATVGGFDMRENASPPEQAQTPPSTTSTTRNPQPAYFENGRPVYFDVKPKKKQCVVEGNKKQKVVVDCDKVKQVQD